MKINIFQSGFKILKYSSTNKLGSKSIKSHSAKSLLISSLQSNFMFQVLYFAILYGGSVKIKSIDLSGIFFISSKEFHNTNLIPFFIIINLLNKGILFHLMLF